jgi:hypothetical protein
MRFSRTKSESLLAFYEGIRRQVELDRKTRGEFRFAGESAKQYAEQLRDEMERRGLQYIAIDWE